MPRNPTTRPRCGVSGHGSAHFQPVEVRAEAAADDHAAGLRSLDSTGAAHGRQCRNNQLPRKSVDLISTLHHFDHVAPSSSCPGPKSWPAKSLSQESLAGAASAMENEHGVHYLATGVALRLPIVV